MSQGKNAVINGKVYTGMLPSGYANADLKWETSEQTDLGIDLRFFNSALTILCRLFREEDEGHAAFHADSSLYQLWQYDGQFGYSEERRYRVRSVLSL